MPFLAGFDPRWHDAPEFLEAVTRDLWEGRRLDLTTEHLAADITSHGGLGALHEAEVVGADLAARIAAFHELSMVAEDTLWTATAQNAFIAAQRFQCAARHDGAGLYGHASGKPLRFLTLSERWCRSGQVQEEWVLRDEAAILRQIGVSEQDGALWRLAAAPAGPAPRPAHPYEGSGNDDPWGHTLGDLIHRVMGGEISAIERHYDPAAELFLPGGIVSAGPHEAEAFWIGLRAAFPSAAFRVEHLLGQEEPLSPPRAAMRWSLTGRHDGHGAFGVPSGAEVEILGITHAEFGPKGLRREWTLYDVPGVWAQILRATGTA